MTRSPLVKRASLYGPVPIAAWPELNAWVFGKVPTSLHSSVEGHRPGAVRLAERMPRLKFRSAAAGRARGLDCRVSGSGASCDDRADIDRHRGGRILHLREAAIGVDDVVGGEVRAVGEFTPGRSLNSQVVSSSVFQEKRASAGRSGSRPGPRCGRRCAWSSSCWDPNCGSAGPSRTAPPTVPPSVPAPCRAAATSRAAIATERPKRVMRCSRSAGCSGFFAR